MRRGSLRLRLLLAGAVSVLVALALSGIGLTVLFARHVERRVEGELSVALDQVMAGLERGPEGSLQVSRAPADPRFAEPLSGLYWQLAGGGAVLRSRSLWDQELALPPDALPDGAMHRHRFTGPGGESLIALERSVALPARLGGGALRAVVALDAAEVTAATRDFAVDLLPYLAVMAAFLVGAAYAQVAVGLRPLAAVRRGLAAIRAGQMKRLGQSFPDEILPLAAEVDALLDARDTQVAQARARAGDLAHGFKTPLQVLAGDADRLRARGEEAIATQIEQVAGTMRRHVDRELARARTAAVSADARAPVAEVVRRVTAVVARTPDGARLRWSADIPDDAVARMDPDDLAEAVGNLLENAARFARTRVAVRCRREADLLVLTVSDDGPGIPAGRIAEVLARGGRLDLAGDGTGLGLAIVQDIAAAWQGGLTLNSGAPGLEAVLRLRA